MNGRQGDRLPSARLRIFEEAGEGFLLGGAFSSAFHFLRGIRNPTGGGGGRRRRLASAASAVRSNAPGRAGSIAALFGLCYAFDRAMVLARRKEDRWNFVAALAATMGVRSMRQGACTAVCSALLGGAVAVLLDGAGHVLENRDSSVTQPAAPPAAAVSRRPPGPDAPVAGFLGIPPGQPIVVEEVIPDSDLSF